MFVHEKDLVLDPKNVLDAYMEALIDEAGKNPDIVHLEADLANCDGGPKFKAAYPDRFFDIGIAEQSLSSIAAGMSVAGRIPFCHSFAAFASRRMCDQNYISCAYAGSNVKIIGTDPAICASFNGGTHQANEDVDIMRAIADITIIEPTDSVMADWVVRKAANTRGMFYIRMQSRDVYKFYEAGEAFEVGKAKLIRDGSDVTLIALGNLMLKACVDAADLLAKEGISARVVDMFTVKPIDVETVVSCANETGAIVTAECHSIIGGLGSAVAETLVENACAAPMKRIGVPDRFGEVGTVPQLQKVMHMTPEDIAAAARKLISEKK